MCIRDSVAPLAILFTDTSTGSPTTWAWDFENDGVVDSTEPVSYTHLRAHETPEHLVCRILLEKNKKNKKQTVVVDLKS